MKAARTTALLIAALTPLIAGAHPGGLAADGCHNDRKNGGRHCHRPPGRSGPPADRPQRLLGGGSYYANCSAARAAGAAPVRRGDPGYARHLDRDGDGVGCE
ncbi:MAG: excalibur calcium-binding domain-containing protein [Sphingopyxis terrae]|nr:excalibur calcium-binding domain-containing protein [Sphingopyxis terrae]